MYEVNRSVIVVVPREPFWYWLNDVATGDLDDLTLEDLQQDANSYLIAACQNADEVWEEVEARLDEIFAAELADWCEDESKWPNLDMTIFSEWFDVVISSIVTDLSSDALQRESFQPINVN